VRLLKTPRDRKGTFEPQLVRKGQRRFWRDRFGRWGLAGLGPLVRRHNHDATAVELAAGSALLWRSIATRRRCSSREDRTPRRLPFVVGGNCHVRNDRGRTQPPNHPGRLHDFPRRPEASRSVIRASASQQWSPARQRPEALYGDHAYECPSPQMLPDGFSDGRLAWFACLDFRPP
jgi:hypothetical protein